VLNQHERHAGALWRVGQKALEGLKASSRRADADDQQHASPALFRSRTRLCLFLAAGSGISDDPAILLPLVGLGKVR